MSVPRVVVVGSSNMDLSIQGQKIPASGETVIGGRFAMAGGGKGANQAIAAARQGAEVFFVSRLGNDLFGRQLMDNFQEENICTDNVFVTEDAATGVALILVDPRGENIISVASGANSRLTPYDVRAALEKVGNFQVLLLQLETPMETVKAAAEAAKQIGATVVLDPAPAAKIPDDVMQFVDIITPNEVEASVLAGIEVHDPDSQIIAAGRLLESGVANVVITLGSRGCCLASKEGCRYISAYEVEAKDTTASGDAFNGTLAYALAAGKPLLEAIEETASAAAALAATRSGAQPSLPTADEVQRFLINAPKANRKRLQPHWKHAAEVSKTASFASDVKIP